MKAMRWHQNNVTKFTSTNVDIMATSAQNRTNKKYFSRTKNFMIFLCLRMISGKVEIDSLYFVILINFWPIWVKL